MECPSSNLLLSFPNEPDGRLALETIQSDLQGFGGRESIELFTDRLSESEAQSYAAKGPYQFARMKIPFGEEHKVAAFLREKFPNRGALAAAEPDYPLRFSAPGDLGLGFALGGHDAIYKRLMGVDRAHAAHVKGAGRRICVIDSGCDPAEFPQGARFWDVTGAHPNATPCAASDNNGHGTAMLKLARSVAPDAGISAIRICDVNGHMSIFGLMAALFIAAVDADADVISMSLGFPAFRYGCPNCGGTASVKSFSLERVTEQVAAYQNNSGRAPVLLAATGNDGKDHEMDIPAYYPRVVAIGSVEASGLLSDFTNYVKGDNQPRHFVLPGGQAHPDRTNLREHTGFSRTQEACFGTSPATAYGAGLLALLWSDRRYQTLSRDSFLDKLERSHASRANGQNADAYGSGVLKWAPPELRVGRSVKVNKASGGRRGQKAEDVSVRLEDGFIIIDGEWLEVDL